MLALRPTFSESWYRVASLRARLRSSTQISRQFYRGERWYVVRDPAGNQFHRLSDAAYRFVGLLDGTRTVEEAWELAGGQLADDAPTQPEVIQILTQLHAANLLEADITPDAAVLLRRHKQMQKRRWQGRMMNLLFPRIPVWDPNQFVERWMPVAKRVMSWWGGLVWIITIVAALALVLPRWGDLKTAADRAIDPNNWLLLWATFVLIKFIHEMGHAVSCRRFGGEVHEMGIMFLVFIPTPYVDASTAWAFPSRWQRMFVGAAGMVTEMFVAALAAFVWASTSYESHPTLNALAYNTMLIASVSTVLFNANPLLRYDGYYMLSDFLEIPNLRQKSTEYTMGLIKRHVFRVKQTQPLPPVPQRAWLFGYGIAATIYRTIIGLVIIFVVIDRVPVLGYLMALGGLITWAVVPLVKTLRYLMIEPELHRKRGRAMGFTAGVAVVIFLLVGVIPLPLRFQAQGVVEPVQREVLRAKTPGFVEQILVKDGQQVRAGQVLVVCRDPELESNLKQMQARLREQETRRALASVDDQAQRLIAERQIEALKRQIALLEEKNAQLAIRAPFDGTVISPNLHELGGMYLPRGQEIAMVATVDRLMVRATLEQAQAELGEMFVRQRENLADQDVDTRTEIRLAGDVQSRLHSIGRPSITSPQDTLPHPAIGYVGGGSVPVDPQDPQGLHPLVRQFEMRVKLDNPDGRFVPGQRAYVQFDLEKRTLFWQVKRWVMQLFQAQSTSAKWT